jgi:hypothetical protein
MTIPYYTVASWSITSYFAGAGLAAANIISVTAIRSVFVTIIVASAGISRTSRITSARWGGTGSRTIGWASTTVFAYTADSIPAIRLGDAAVFISCAATKR